MGSIFLLYIFVKSTVKRFLNISIPSINILWVIRSCPSQFFGFQGFDRCNIMLSTVKKFSLAGVEFVFAII